MHPLDAALCRLTEASRRRAASTLAGILILTIGLGVYAASHLSFNVDPNSFFSEDLRFQQAIREFEQYFPVLTNSLLIVVEGDTPEITRAAAEDLTRALEAQPQMFHRAFEPWEARRRRPA